MAFGPTVLVDLFVRSELVAGLKCIFECTFPSANHRRKLARHVSTPRGRRHRSSGPINSETVVGSCRGNRALRKSAGVVKISIRLIPGRLPGLEPVVPPRSVPTSEDERSQAVAPPVVEMDARMAARLLHDIPRIPSRPPSSPLATSGPPLLSRSPGLLSSSAFARTGTTSFFPPRRGPGRGFSAEKLESARHRNQAREQPSSSIVLRCLVSPPPVAVCSSVFDPSPKRLRFFLRVSVAMEAQSRISRALSGVARPRPDIFRSRGRTGMAMPSRSFRTSSTILDIDPPFVVPPPDCSSESYGENTGMNFRIARDPVPPSGPRSIFSVS